MPSVLLMTGDQVRHRFVAHWLASRLNLVGIVSEAKPALPAGESQQDCDVLARHFAERDAAESRWLEQHSDFPDVPLRAIPNGLVNARDNFDWVRSRNADVVVLYGTGLIKEPLLSVSGRMVNLHLGLSPWYRGAGTNFWPFVHEQPECVGATIHIVAAEVDAGDILAQVRPEWSASDRIHDAGTKTIIAAADKMVEVVLANQTGRLAGDRQDLVQGRVFRQKDFNAAAVRTAWRNLDQGMIARYLESREARDMRFPIVAMEAAGAAVS